MIQFNFRKKLSKEDDFASEVLEIIEEKLDEMKVEVPEKMLEEKDEQIRFREDLRKELIYEIADFIATNKKVLTKKVA